MRLLSMLAVFATCLGATLSAQTLEITPSRVLADEVVTIRARGLAPNERITIHAETIDGNGKRWEAQADFAADAQATVDVSKQAPLGGSYKDISAMGLIWSMMPAEKDVNAYAS